jgi:hypothetical protein
MKITGINSAHVCTSTQPPTPEALVRDVSARLEHSHDISQAEVE